MTRACPVCRKRLKHWQKNACCHAHDREYRHALMAKATGLGERRCEVSGCDKLLTKKPDETWARFQNRRGCCQAHAAILSAATRALAISRAAQERGLNARPEQVAESWV